MSKLTLLLSARQSVCFVNYVANDQHEVGATRTVFFTAEADDKQKLRDKPLQATGHNITIRELPDVGMAGTLEYSHALDAYGKQTQIQADITLSFPHHAFEQILHANLDSTNLYLHVDMAAVSYEMWGQHGGGGEAVIQTARLGFLQKATHPQEPATEKILKLLYGILGALVIVIVILASR